MPTDLLMFRVMTCSSAASKGISRMTEWQRERKERQCLSLSCSSAASKGVSRMTEWQRERNERQCVSLTRLDLGLE